MKIQDLPARISASKSDWLAGTSWLGFSPADGSLTARNRCEGTIQRQIDGGYVIEYITETFGDPNPGFEKDPGYLQEREAHKELAGRLIAVHKLRPSSRPLEVILGTEEFKRIQDMWDQSGDRVRWSVAFPIVESYQIIGRPKAKAVFGEAAYSRLYAHSSATLRPLTDDECTAIAQLEIRPTVTKNAWIGIEDEAAFAEQSEIDPRTQRNINADLTDKALEGVPAERRAKIRIRAAWLAHDFIKRRGREGRLVCDECGFNPAERVDSRLVSPRSILDVHHKHPLEEGIRYTTINDFTLYCPTCHRIEHAMLKARAKAAI